MMTLHRVDINGDADVEGIAIQVMLAAAGVFSAKFPGDEGQPQWEAAMVTLVRVIHEHVRHGQRDNPPPVAA
jgi:hypothetical protein